MLSVSARLTIIGSYACVKKKQVAAKKKVVKAAKSSITKHKRKVNLEDNNYNLNKDIKVKDSKVFNYKVSCVICYNNSKSSNNLFTIYVAKGVKMPIILGKTFKLPNILALLCIISVYNNSYKSLAYKRLTHKGILRRHI
ncbi:uncharacterized protein BDR25DRAFT_316409 [Lindgomyces ingoldianus]|uniref:Uncharacterized protein n=1 Tax=Lindgomyces ingoldianus TaxID=673940 RepID=A0ACB6QNN4_9PLEO|nr:uncharacterized protein BDR25DRAFT_316409 [Lindgomyces ingoldianus]KAF2467766.1 hypothetical protein BDR25DRAFT_316409 [Lindgomyces ingoldianus]